MIETSLIPAPVKHDAAGEGLPPWDWAWPRSEAYEAAATAVLPAGWVLYSVLTEHSPTPEIGEAWARIAGKDFGATRHDARAHVFGVREIDGSAKHLRAEVRGLGDFSGTEQNFDPGDLAAACAWCDEQIAGRS